MERTVGTNEKLESLKLESFAKVGKGQAKLERTELSWKVRAEVELSKFKRSFPTSVGSFQFGLSNFFPKPNEVEKNLF